MIAFAKMHGCGNDFVVVDERKLGAKNWAELAPGILDRRFGVGADSLLVLAKSTNCDARMRIFEKDKNGDRPVNALHKEIYQDEHFKDLILFYEYFHGDSGRGVGATHQTGWTGVVAHLINESCWSTKKSKK